MRVLTSHPYGPGSNPEPVFTCELSLLLVLVFALRVFLRVLQFSSPSQRPFFQIPTRRKNSGQAPPLSGVSTDEFTYHMRQRLASCVYYEEGGLQSEGLAAKEDKASTLTRVSSLARVSPLKRVSPLAIVSCS